MSSPGPGQMLFAFVRHWSRRSTAAELAMVDQGRVVLVAEAVHSLEQRGVRATVNAVAHELGIDQSGASRLISAATSPGFLTMAPPTSDRRRREASLTASGRSMLEQAHQWQEQVFDRLTNTWSASQRRDFQQAMADLMNRSYTMTTQA